MFKQPQLAANITALTYLSRLQHKTYLWGHGFFKSEENSGSEDAASCAPTSTALTPIPLTARPATNLAEELRGLPEGGYTVRSSGEVLTLAKGVGSRAVTLDSHADKSGNAPTTLSGNFTSEEVLAALQRGHGKK